MIDANSYSSYLYPWYVTLDYAGVKPVINLRSDVNLSGNGTISSPYVVLNS